VPIHTGRTLENTANATIAGELLPAIPHAFSLPFSGAFKSDSSLGYITDYTAGSVVVFDVDTDRVVTSITGLGNPIGAAVSGDDTLLYVANSAGGAGSIKEINLSTHAVTARSLASTAVFPGYVALSPDETKLAVSCLGGGGVTNRLYVYNVPAWTLAATCVIGGADALSGKIAWEGNDVVWVPIPSHNAVYRCVSSTQTVSYNFSFTAAQSVAVSSGGLGESLFVVSPSNTYRAAYYVLPSNATTAPTFYDGGSEADFISLGLSTDDFIYEGTTNGQIKVYQGGTVFFTPSNQPFWGDVCKIEVWGGEAA
jgi:YVTN family beta-propeller protein